MGPDSPFLSQVIFHREANIALTTASGLVPLSLTSRLSMPFDLGILLVVLNGLFVGQNYASNHLTPHYVKILGIRKENYLE